MGRNHRNGIIWSACAAAAASNESARGRCEIAFISNISCAALFIEKWAPRPAAFFVFPRAPRRAPIDGWMNSPSFSLESGKRQLLALAINAIIEDCARSIPCPIHITQRQRSQRPAHSLGLAFSEFGKGVHIRHSALPPRLPASPFPTPPTAR